MPWGRVGSRATTDCADWRGFERQRQRLWRGSFGFAQVGSSTPLVTVRWSSFGREDGFWVGTGKGNDRSRSPSGMTTRTATATATAIATARQRQLQRQLQLQLQQQRQQQKHECVGCVIRKLYGCRRCVTGEYNSLWGRETVPATSWIGQVRDTFCRNSCFGLIVDDPERIPEVGS
jgi:hypothetical protein